MTEVSYGFPCVENPHDFEPDHESCTPEEVAFHAEAKKRWDSGERNVRGNRSEWLTNDKGERVMHITRTSWGIGTNTFEIDEDGEL